jgi:hypothetical protein
LLGEPPRRPPARRAGLVNSEYHITVEIAFPGHLLKIFNEPLATRSIFKRR